MLTVKIFHLVEKTTMIFIVVGPDTDISFVLRSKKPFGRYTQFRLDCVVDQDKKT